MSSSVNRVDRSAFPSNVAGGDPDIAANREDYLLRIVQYSIVRSSSVQRDLHSRHRGKENTCALLHE